MLIIFTFDKKLCVFDLQGKISFSWYMYKWHIQEFLFDNKWNVLFISIMLTLVWIISLCGWINMHHGCNLLALEYVVVIIDMSFWNTYGHNVCLSMLRNYMYHEMDAVEPRWWYVKDSRFRIIILVVVTDWGRQAKNLLRKMFTTFYNFIWYYGDQWVNANISNMLWLFVDWNIAKFTHTCCFC